MNIVDIKSDYEHNNILLFLEKLLFDVEEILESQRTKSNIKYEVEKFNDVFKHFILEDCDNVFTSKSRQNNDQSKNINNSNNVILEATT